MDYSFLEPSYPEAITNEEAGQGGRTGCGMVRPEDSMAGPTYMGGEDGQEGSGGTGAQGPTVGGGVEAQGRPAPEQGKSDALIWIQEKCRS